MECRKGEGCPITASLPRLIYLSVFLLSASGLASLLALSAGFSVVLVAGAVCYGVALTVVSGQ